MRPSRVSPAFGGQRVEPLSGRRLLSPRTGSTSTSPSTTAASRRSRSTRPDKLNALTFDSYADLRDLLAELPNRDDVKVLVITGTGPRLLLGRRRPRDHRSSAGDGRTRELLDFTRMTGQVVQRMRELPMPIIASINGIAAGAGSVIALAADLQASRPFGVVCRSCSPRSGSRERTWARPTFFPAWSGSGERPSCCFSGTRSTPRPPSESGSPTAWSTTTICPPSPATWPERLASGPTFAYAATKMLLTRELDMDLGGSLELEAMTQALLMTTEDHKEFYAAFKEGRNPVWTGR